MVGQTLAHYEILEKIGSGGMGDVYLAEDTKLDRKVALKVFPPEFAENEERRARFTREAKTIAALNHPNIVTVFSVEETDGVHFITMELVKGKMLAELLPRQGFSLETFFDVAVPLTDAVAAAHAKGIVHRDLKPGNIMVTDEGRLKVLDFGLAKPTVVFTEGEAVSQLPTAAKTEKGVILGTVSYMSPEQAQGKTVDTRSDIFSLGTVFYEMLTGSRPFQGDTAAEALSSVIKDAPPNVGEIRSGIPRELSRTVRRCLAKDPSRRLQSALDIRNELEELRRELDSGELVAEAPLAQGRRSHWAVLTVAATALALIAVVWRITTKPPGVSVPRLVNPVQITSTTGVENHPTWAPDGGRIAYDSDQSGNLDIWVTQLSGKAAVNLTAEHQGFDRDPAWSPDGSQIAYVSERNGGGIYVIPAIGGRPDKISPRTPLSGAQWSADGSELASIVTDPPDSFIEIVSVRTRQTHRLTIPGSAGNRLDLRWSPDGRFFAYVRAASRGADVSRIWVLRASDWQTFAVTDGRTGDWSPMWSADASTLFFLSNRGGSMDLWQQPITVDGQPEGRAEALTVGIGMQYAALSSDGQRLVYSKGRPVSNLWRVPIPGDAEFDWAEAEQLTFDQALIRSVDLSPDGESLVFSSDRGGNSDIWVASSRGDDMKQVTADPSSDRLPRWSPDGRHIAYMSFRRGNWDIWAIPLNGGPAVPVTEGDGSEMPNSWSPDGREIAFHGDMGTRAVEIFTVPVAGGEARQMTSDDVQNFSPQWSPDGEWLVYDSNREDGVRRLWRVPTSGGPAQMVTKGPGVYSRWSPDGTRIYYAPTYQSRELWVLTVANGIERLAAQFGDRPGARGAFDVGEEYLYFAWKNDLGDIWVMDVVTDEDS